MARWPLGVRTQKSLADPLIEEGTLLEKHGRFPEKVFVGLELDRKTN